MDLLKLIFIVGPMFIIIGFMKHIIKHVCLLIFFISIRVNELHKYE